VTTLDFAGRLVGPACATYITAELGYNWCVSSNPRRNLDELERLISTAADSGADCVKLQLRSLNAADGYYASKGENLDAPISDPSSPWKTRREFVEAREPDEATLEQLDRVCGANGVQWTASPWDVPSVELLSSWDPPWIKLASASITDHDVLRAVAATGKPIVLSTGMATYAEISTALDTLGDAYPSRLILAHTTSSYPCPDEDVNLAAMDRLRDFMCPVGYSGHEDGIALTFAAVVRGACWVERHVTMSRSHWHKDHRASLEPDGLRRLVRDIRRYERAVGDGVKRLMPSEAPFLSLRRVS
jgi:N-acetylneuraminate synthase